MRTRLYDVITTSGAMAFWLVLSHVNAVNVGLNWQRNPWWSTGISVAAMGLAIVTAAYLHQSRVRAAKVAARLIGTEQEGWRNIRINVGEYRRDDYWTSIKSWTRTFSGLWSAHGQRKPPPPQAPPTKR